MVDVQSSLACTRCNISLQFAGKKEFHEGSLWKEALIGNWAQDSVVMDVYYCPKCGHVEMFMDGIGNELRSKPEDC